MSMNDKPDRTLLGILLIVAALFFLFSGFFTLTPILNVAVGMAFLLLFRTKKISWALVVGVCIMLFGLRDIISELLPPGIASSLFSAALYIASAVVFLILYYTKNKLGLLPVAMLLLWMGIYTLLREVSFVDSFFGGGLMTICVGSALISTYIIGRVHTGRWMLTLGVILCMYGFIFGSGVINWPWRASVAVAGTICAVIVMRKRRM